MTKKLWLSDQVPGGMVRKLESRDCARQAPWNGEQLLESFQGSRQPTRPAYNACMNQNGILTALCSQELNFRTHLSQPGRTETFSCPAQAPTSNGETMVVLHGGSQDLGREPEIVPPHLPPILQAPLPQGFLRGGTPLTKQ